MEMLLATSLVDSALGLVDKGAFAVLAASFLLMVWFGIFRYPRMMSDHDQVVKGLTQSINEQAKLIGKMAVRMEGFERSQYHMANALQRISVVMAAAASGEKFNVGDLLRFAVTPGPEGGSAAGQPSGPPPGV